MHQPLLCFNTPTCISLIRHSYYIKKITHINKNTLQLSRDSATYTPDNKEIQWVQRFALYDSLVALAC